MNNMEIHHLQYSNKTIEFILKRKNVKNVNLKIKPDMTVEVSANEKVPLSFIYDFVKGKGAWIIKHIGNFKNVQPHKQSERDYVSGESYRYLGKQYRLRVQQTTEEERVKYLRGFIYLYVKDVNNHSRKSKLMELWYREKAQITFENSLEKMYQLVNKYSIVKPRVEIRQMKVRWGSALLETNTVLLNIDLIKAPKHCIDYVILHELIHFKFNNHSDSFYEMLYSLMPDWEKRKSILDEEVVKDL